MSADDDDDCAAHEWVLQELGTRGAGKGLDAASECARCGAVNYEPAPDMRARPPL